MRWAHIWECPYDDEGWKVWMDENPGKVALQVTWEKKVAGCKRCKLHESRTKIVYGVGQTERPVIAFVGEGPGAVEDRTGLPFVGPAGNLLNGMLKAMGLTRADVYICNVIACRPPDNRDPKDEEIEACKPVWASQLVAVRPRVIVALGKVAGNVLLGLKSKTVAELRQQWRVWNGIPLQVTYHPAGMLRNSSYKPAALEDLQGVMVKLEELEKSASDHGPLFGGKP